jgi:hypothetical protein
MILYNDFPLDCYCRLAADIIEMACRDYIQTLKKCRKAFTPEERQNLNNWRKVQEAWFRGAEFGGLNYSGFDPEYIISQCKRVAKFPPEWG